MRVTLDTVYRLPTWETKFPFFISVCSKQMKFAVSVFRLQHKTEVVVCLRNAAKMAS
jgi:hypothetical protein